MLIKSLEELDGQDFNDDSQGSTTRGAVTSAPVREVGDPEASMRVVDFKSISRQLQSRDAEPLAARP